MALGLPPDSLRELIRHMEWADASVWRALSAHPPALGDPRIRALMLHLHGVQRAFLSVWTSQPFESPGARGETDLVIARAAVRAYYDELSTATEGFDEATLLRPVVMPGLEPYEKQMGITFGIPTFGETVLQVTSHSTYHRGQVNARLRELGGEPPLVDYIAWIWFGRPAPDWTEQPSPQGGGLVNE